MTMHPKLRPGRDFLFVKLSKRTSTPGGLVVPATAGGYTTIDVIAKGPLCTDAYAVGDSIMPVPGRNVLVTFDEHPDYAMIHESDVLCADDRWKDEGSPLLVATTLGSVQ